MWTSSGRRSIRWRRRASSARCWRSTRPASRTNLTPARTSRGCWSDQPVETLQLLAAFGAAWAQIDEPKFRLSIRQNLLPNVRTFYYLRLHGRNAAQWWGHDKSEDRYNYLYSAEELHPFAEAAREASREVKKAYLYANNHFSAKSVANAAILKHDLGQPLPGEYPQEFVDRYPDLKGLVKVLPDPLLRTPS